MRSTTATIETISNGNVVSQKNSKVFTPNLDGAAEKVGEIAQQLITDYFVGFTPIDEGDKYNVTVSIELASPKKR